MDFDKERTFQTYCNCEKSAHYEGSCVMPYASTGTIKTAFKYSVDRKVRLTFYEDTPKGTTIVTIKNGEIVEQ